jgi:hypothetical protein
MANVLFLATATPAVIKSGDKTMIVVSYEASDAGPMTIGASNGYSITSTRRPLSVGKDNEDSFEETISGPKGDCFLTFVFDGSGTTTVVTIT